MLYGENHSTTGTKYLISFPKDRFEAQAWQHGYAEQLMRTIKEKEVDLSEYRNFTEAYEQIEQFLEKVYMKKRIHLSLNYLTPNEYEKKWNKQQNTNVI
jgi:putative transposase